MSILKLSLCAAVATAAMGFASAASAQDAGYTVAFNAGAATDYVFRGVDQTGDQDQGEVFGGVDLTVSQFYAGAWLSTTGLSGANGAEYDLYAGWKPSIGPVALDLGAIYYGYTKDSLTPNVVSPDFNTLEWKAAASLPIGPATVGAAAYYSNDFAGTDEDSWYYELNASYTLANKATVSGAVGQFQTDAFVGSPDSYLTWNAGVTYPITDKVGVDLRYIGTDGDARTLYGRNAYSGAVATLKVSF
ncbi:MAG: porin [Brevundimonas sp.]|nr:MAG: porin [Brevundimonas sp.]